MYNITSILCTAYLRYEEVGLCDIDIVAMCVNAIIVVAWGTTKSDNTYEKEISMPPGGTRTVNKFLNKFVLLKFTYVFYGVDALCGTITAVVCFIPVVIVI